MRNAYAAHADGATGFYVDEGSTYTNPHDGGVREALVRAVRAWPDLFAPADQPGTADRILDLSCGSGEVTAALVAAGVKLDRIDACDPYTGAAYERRIGKKCANLPAPRTPRGVRRTRTHENPLDAPSPTRRAETWSFEDIARGVVADRSWRAVICSFAMHLCARDYLPTLCMMLAVSTDALVVLTPHKRPELDPAWGWFLRHESRDTYWRIRTRRYGTGDAGPPLDSIRLEAARDGGSEDEEDVSDAEDEQRRRS